MGRSWHWYVLIWNHLRLLHGICFSSDLRILHGQFTCGIRDGVDLNGKARMLGDVPIRNQVHIKKTVRAIPGPQEVDFCKAATPTFEPEQQSFHLFFVSLEMQQDVDVAGGPRRGVLGATDKVEGFHTKLLRIEICRDLLCHAKTPAPVFIRSPVNELSLGLD